MVSRRNFITITVIMLVVIFLFQIPEVARSHMNDYQTNSYAARTKTRISSAQVCKVTREQGLAAGRYIVYIGNLEDEAVGSVVKRWCLYTKRYVQAYASIQEYHPKRGEKEEAVFIDSAYIDFDSGEMERCQEYAEAGHNLVFCNLPEVQVFEKSAPLRYLTGVQEVVNKKKTVDGIRMLPGFLLGGQKEYILDSKMEEEWQDLELTLPWYRVSSGTKTYMAGMLNEVDGDTLKNEDLPVIVWRNSIGSAFVFAVNGDYLNENTGLGFLSAILSEMKPYDIYPVVNAQNFVIVNYPEFVSENDDKMMELYSQPLNAVYKDIVWPNLVSIAQQNENKMTCLMAPQMNYEDEAEPDGELLVYYMKLLREQSAEAGLSATAVKNTDLMEKLEQDDKFLRSELKEFPFLSFYQDDLSDSLTKEALQQELLQTVRTVFSDYREKGELFSYLDTEVTKQRAVNDGYEHKFSDNLRLRCMETAFAYSSIATDVSRVAYPVSDEDSWEKLSLKLSSNTGTYWKEYPIFQKTTLAESDVRIRRFLALNYRQKADGKKITLEISSFDEEAWFIFRTHGETIEKVKGAEYTELEKDVYLIQALEEKVELQMKTHTMAIQ